MECLPETFRLPHRNDVTRIDHPPTLPTAINNLLRAIPTTLFHVLPHSSPLLLAVSEEFLTLILTHEGSLQYQLSCHEVVMRVLGAAVMGGIVVGPSAGIDRPLLPSEWLIESEAEAEVLFVVLCRRKG
ncbi:hypothetical protein B0H14DRAFT_3452311 [Mycena olivaceomarginata]|nr:hypothetical protein B0H14DRAFT_3452311 [Mycena olivaceomarginata]